MSKNPVIAVESFDEVIDRSQSLRHFLTVAKRGERPGASGGEKAAYAIARACLDHAVRMGETAVIGLMEFVAIAKHQPCMADELCAFKG